MPLSRLISGQVLILELISQGRPLSAILGALIGLIEGAVDDALCCMMSLDPGTDRLSVLLAPNLPTPMIEASNGLSVSLKGRSCGAAAYQKRPVIVSDIGLDPLWAEHRDLALGHGLRRCWSHPILSKDRQVLGVFAMYGREARRPTPDDALVLTLASQLAGIALEQDQSARELQEAETHRQADAMKDEFLNIVSHELKAPIATIAGMLNLFEHEINGPLTEQQHQDVRRMKESTNTLIALITDLLDVNSIRGGRLAIMPRRIAFAELVDRTIDNLRSLARKHGHFLSHTVPLAMPEVEVDPQRITQVLTNLILNAIKFTPEGGRIGVEVTIEGGTLRCTVSDTGPGIPEDERDKLFRKFSKLARPGHGGEGVGLGLYICQALVTAHGGTIGVDSQFGEGSRFWFTLPTRN